MCLIRLKLAYCPYKGQVEIADWVGGYGLTVIINHTSAQQTLYGHMSRL